MARPTKFDQDAVVDKAVEVFWRQGYAGTTPQGLADELGIGKGSLYNTFESKHHLFTLALRRYSRMRVEALADELARPGLVRPRLRAAVLELTGVGTHRHGCLVINAVAELAQGDETVAAVADELFHRIEDAFRTAIEHGRGSGELTVHDHSTAASGLLTAVIGASILAKACGDLNRVLRVVNAAVDRL
jgi:TetR/AcrR family transcriptional repressor of nem operon